MRKKNNWLQRNQPVILFLLCFFLPGCLLAQVSFVFTPELNGRTLNGLFTAQLMNNSSEIYTGTIKIIVREANNRIVVQAQTGSILIKPGLNTMQLLSQRTKMMFGNNSVASITAQTGRFPENDYEYCFGFDGSNTKQGNADQFFENCFNYSIQSLIPLSLLYPEDQEEICNTRPDFTWQPQMPLLSSCRYRLLLAEQKEKQTAADAILNNMPVLYEENISAVMLSYPPAAAALEVNKKYAWQVTAYDRNTMISKSELYSFSTHCNNATPDSSRDSYRQPGITLNGSYYLTGNMLRFSLLNTYAATKLQYSITDFADPGKEIGNLPLIKLQPGLNKVDLEMEDINGLKPGRMYLLRIKNIGNSILYLQFLYQ